MSNPVKKVFSVGVTGITIYPWADGGTGVFDATTQEVLEGLRGLKLGITTTDAEGFGGESVQLLESVEVKREVEVQGSAFKCSLRAWALLTGDDLAVDASSGQGGEVQYIASGKAVRAPYFRLVGQSTLGSGLVVLTFPRMKWSGSLNFSMDAESITIPEFSAKATLDTTYVRKDGTVGASYDWFYGDGGTAARHS